MKVTKTFMRDGLQCVGEAGAETVFLKGGMSTTAKAYFQPDTERLALKCSSCNAPMYRGEFKCQFCGTEYAYMPGPGNPQKPIDFPTRYFV